MKPIGGGCVIRQCQYTGEGGNAVFNHFDPNANEGYHELKNIDIHDALPSCGQAKALRQTRPAAV
eukprot:scaffold28708_cov46-Attheya_sp.AAC.1